MKTRFLFRAFGTTALTVLLALVLAGSAMAQTRQGHQRGPNPRDQDYKGCGAIPVSQEHDWISYIDGIPKQAGNHWIVSLESQDISCDFARHVASHIVDKSARYFDSLDHTGLLRDGEVDVATSHCTWRVGVNDHERVKPFQVINCHFLEPHGKRGAAQGILQAQIDPDPRYIFEA
jgi:hypothetical protein